MAELSTLARPYAKAAFDYAHEHNVLNDWEEFLLVSSHFTKDDTFKQLLHNPAISAEKKTMVLIDLYDSQISEGENSALFKIFEQLTRPNSNNKVSKELKNFINQLAEFDRLALIPEIYTHYRQHKAKVLKQVDAYVTTAYPLTDVQKTLIQTQLTSSLNATVVIHETVDQSLIAGVTIKVGDKIVDDTVRGKLKQLKTQLTA